MHSVQYFFLLIFLFFLPLYEAPKNIFSVLFVVFGIWVAIRNRVFFKCSRLDQVVVLFCLLLAVSPFVAGINSPYAEPGERFASALNWSLMPLVALVLMISELSRDQILWMLRVVCLGTVLAVLQAFYDWSGPYPELNSVGHVNQSALYLAFSLIPAGLLYLYRQHQADLALVGVVVLSVIWYQGPAQSMIGFGATVLVIAGFWIIYCLRRKTPKMLGVSFVLGAVVVISAVNLQPTFFGPYEGFKREFDARLASKSDPYSQRDRLLNSALEVAGDSLVGFGLGSFGRAVEQQNIRAAVERRGGDWVSERGRFFSSAHGHNIFTNVLVERGWLGIFATGCFLLCMLMAFLIQIKNESAQVGLITITVICMAGLGQSTLHVEHGQLAFICLALCLKFGLTSRATNFKRTQSYAEL